jgi:YD repeat-containing protein
MWYEVPGSEQFGNGDGSNVPQSYFDNTADANLVTAAPSTNTTGTNLTGNFNVGVNNAAVNQQKSVTLNTDTRTTNLTFNSSNQLSTVTEVDPNNSNAIVSTTTLTYNSSNQLTTITHTAGGHTVTTTLNYTNNQLSSVTKAVN